MILFKQQYITVKKIQNCKHPFSLFLKSYKELGAIIISYPIYLNYHKYNNKSKENCFYLEVFLNP